MKASCCGSRIADAGIGDESAKYKRREQEDAGNGSQTGGRGGRGGRGAAVRQMFDSIAPRYDLLNHVLSANVDRLWWRRAARRFRDVLARPEAAILDICCGTGDLTMALLKLRPRGARPILAGDFARAMLRRGAQKFGRPDSHIAPATTGNRARLTRSPSRPMRCISRCVPSRSI